MMETKYDYDREWLKKEFGAYAGIRDIEATPEMAERWLNCNTHNRPLNERRIALYQKSMDMGLWAPSNDCIAWDENGMLMNGQKRLWALLNLKETKSDIKVAFSIKWGISRNPSKNVFTMDYIDRQQQRTASHNWWLRLRKSSCTYRPSDIGKICNIFAKVFSGGERQTIEAPEIELIYKSYKSEFDLILNRREGNKRLSTAPILTGLVFAAKIEPEKVLKFQEVLYSWVNLQSGSPILCLARKLIDRPSREGLSRIPIFKETLTAIKYYIEENPLFKLYTSDAGYDYFSIGQEQIVEKIRTRIKFNQNKEEIEAAP